MKLTFDETIKKRLAALNVTAPAIWALDYDDSLTPNGVADACDIVTRFRLVALASKAQLPEEFDAALDTELGQVYYKSWGARFMDPHMKLRLSENGYALEFMGDGGLLSNNAEIVDYRELTLKKTKENYAEFRA